MVEYSPKILASEEKATTTTKQRANVPHSCLHPGNGQRHKDNENSEKLQNDVFGRSC